MAGRKSLKDELGILRRYADLTEPYFKFLKKMLNSKSKAEQMWACEQLKNAFPKFIPQQLTGEDGGPIQVTVTNYGNSVTLPLSAPTVSAPSVISD